jgi:nucleolar protein 12
MSLLGSIFGAKEEDKEASDLFAKSSALPERPHHKPVVRPPRKRKESSTNEDNDPNKKEKKKQRRTKAEKDEELAKKAKGIEENKDAAEKEPKEGVEEANDDDEEEEVDDSKNVEERTIFVGNLPLATTTRKSLAAIFKVCGPVASSRIRSVPVQGIKLPPQSKGNQNLVKKVCANTKQVHDTFKNTVQGYVVFKQIESVAKALLLNNTKVDGLMLRVDKASPTVDPSRSVFCGNLPYQAEESTLQAHFVKGCELEDVGDVVAVRIIRDKETFHCKGFGYVLFREKSMIPAALKLHESTYMKKQIRVLVCGKRFKGRKGDQKPPTQEQATKNREKVTVGAFRRMLGKQDKVREAVNKRKRGGQKKAPEGAGKKPANPGGLSKRAALDKKVNEKVKKLQKRASKGMGKTRHG